MTAALFTIRLASGGVVGPVAIHGAGGAIPSSPDARRRVEVLIERATAGRRLDAFEPEPGHVRSYVATPTEDEREGLIDLRGATLLGVEAG